MTFDRKIVEVLPMGMDEQELVRFLRQAGKIGLSSERKQVLREDLLILMKKKPLPRKTRGVFMTHFFDTFTVKRFASSGMIAVLALLLVGSGVSFAAEKALPGEVLYPIKRSVNERVRETLAFTPQVEADWAVEQTKRRVTEADELSLQGRLSEVSRKEIEESASQSAERVERLTQDMETKKNIKGADQVKKNLDKALRSGKKVHAHMEELHTEDKTDCKVTIHDGDQDESEE